MRAVEKTRNRNATVEAPPSKAHTLRALVLAALAEGRSVVSNALLGEDQLNVIRCLKGLGVAVREEPNGTVIEGTGGRFQPSGAELNVGESGVGMNFLTAASCLAERPVTLTGAKGLLRRPIAELVLGLRQLGGKVDWLAQEGFPPVRVAGGGLDGGRSKMSGAMTSQYFSALAASSPCARSPVTLVCTDELSEKPYLDITIDMMSRFGVVAANDRYREIAVPNVRTYRGREYRVEGDWSSASFFFLAAAVSRSRVTVTGLEANTKQGDRVFPLLLERMGCLVSAGAGVTVEGRPMKGIDEDMADVPDLLPPIAVAAAFAEGPSRFRRVANLRHKESDRLAAMISELAKMGVPARVEEDALVVEGGQALRGARIDPHNDHRIAMSFAVAGLATGEMEIENENCVAKSFPDFWERLDVFFRP